MLWVSCCVGVVSGTICPKVWQVCARINQYTTFRCDFSKVFYTAEKNMNFFGQYLTMFLKRYRIATSGLCALAQYDART